MKPFYRFAWTLVRIFVIVYCRLKRVNVENIPKTGGMIVASNHVSGIDPPLLGCSIKRPLYFMAKKELFNNIVLKLLISNLNAIPVDRGVFDRTALQRSEDALKAGYGLILFPEGTRSKTGELGKGKPGIGMLARKAGVQILPIYLKNSKIFYKIPFTTKRLEIWYGKPLNADWVNSLPDEKQSYRDIVARLMEEITKLKETAESS